MSEVTAAIPPVVGASTVLALHGWILKTSFSRYPKAKEKLGKLLAKETDGETRELYVKLQRRLAAYRDIIFLLWILDFGLSVAASVVSYQSGVLNGLPYLIFMLLSLAISFDMSGDIESAAVLGHL